MGWLLSYAGGRHVSVHECSMGVNTREHSENERFGSLAAASVGDIGLTSRPPQEHISCPGTLDQL